MEDIERQFEDIKSKAPPNPKGKPSAEQLVLLQEHKKRIKDFLEDLTEEERLFIKGSKKGSSNESEAKNTTQKKKKKSSIKKQKTDEPHILLKPKKDPVCLGWDANAHAFDQVITFYSHKNRSNKQEEEDDTIFNGFDRRVCSNLYLQDKQKLYVPKLLLDDSNEQTNLMKWDFLSTTPGLSSEHFFQAAKCVHEYDAIFIMKCLNPMQAAEYGQSRMGLTNAQKKELVELGAHPQHDFKMFGSSQELKNHFRKLSNNGKLISSASESEPIWVRSGKDQDGLLPRREDWEDVKAHVMLHIVRHKFKGTASPAVESSTDAAMAAVDASPPLDKVVIPSESIQALLSLPSIPLFVEHTKNDTTWADGNDGRGSNLLGKAITQVLLELADEVEPAPLDLIKVDGLRRPNNELVDYSFPEITRPSKPRRVENPDIDYLCILDFEATCDDVGPTPKPQEIIEFPTLLLNTRTGKVEQEFHLYIKPDVHPTLSTFCTELTGITQDMVNSGVCLDDALSEQQDWFTKHNLVSYTPESLDKKDDQNPQNTFLFVTCGDWDLSSCLPRQLHYHKQKVPPTYQRWINIKHAFRDLYRIKPMGMTHMLRLLDMELIGRHHSGIDDCRNIARICCRMLEDGWEPKET